MFMMAYCWHRFRDPMYLVTWNRSRVISYSTLKAITRSYQLALVPSAVLISLSVFAVIGAMYGIAVSFSSRLTGLFATLTLFFGAVQVYEICTGGLLALARYTMTLGTLLAVVSGYGLQRMCERVAPKRMFVAHGVIFGLLLLNSAAVLAASEFPNRYAEKFASVSPRLRYPARVQGVGNYLRSHLGPADAVVLDGYDSESTTLADAAGLPLLAGRRAYLATSKNSVTVRDYIRVEHPRFLVYAQEGVLAGSLRLPQGCRQWEIDEVQFSCVFAGDTYRIYELSYR